ncbi:MAG: succinyl-diaminopimelate desuccinylase [Actinomycetota bacterium]|nr:succinyl-diaminopimelate desuccinylase [Actinomycetota bacterium]
MAAELVAIRSESHDEGRIADRLEAELRTAPWLTVDRLGDNVVARTTLGRSSRLVLAGHTDTVPANGNATPRIEGDVLWGLGSADMKAGLAVMLELARQHADPAVDVTYVFYAREEVAAVHSGLGELFDQRPDLLEGDVAVLGEPTDGEIEAGCQGSLRFRLTLQGARAHLARAWMGRNAIHRLAPILSAIDADEPRRPVLLGCEFHESLQVVKVDGGVAGNVVPDLVELEIGHRFAPDRSSDEAEAHVRDLLTPLLEDGDTLELLDVAPAAFPALEHPCVVALVDRNGLGIRGKLGWTDVARFAERGIPAVNLGPGQSTLAHTAEERVERDSLVRTYAALDDLLRTGP